MADEEIKGMAVKLSLDNSTFSAGMKDLKTQMSVIDSSFKASVAGVKNWGSTLDGLKANADALGQKMTVQSQIVAAYNTKLDESKAKLDSKIVSMTNLKAKLDTTNTAYEQSRAALGANDTASVKLKTDLDSLTQEYTASEKAVSSAKSSVDGYTIQVNNATGKLNGMKSELAETNSKIDNFGKSTKNATESSSLLSNIFKGGFFANIASNALSSLTGFIKQFSSEVVTAAADLAKMSTETGISTTNLQELKYASTLLDVDFDNVSQMVTKTTKAISSATSAGKDYIQVADGLTVKTKDSTGALRSTESVFYDIIDALGSITNETEMDVAAQGIFAKSYQNVIPLVKAGSAGLKEMSTEAHSAGAVLSEDAVEGLANFKDHLEALEISIQDFVGKGLAAIISTGDDATTTFNKLNDSMTANNSTLELIAKYKELSAEFRNSSLTETQLSEKTTELEKVKQDLITASNGVVTAFNIENGTFDTQVTALESMTQAQKDNLKYQLIAQALKNADEGSAAAQASAKSKAEAAQTSYTKALAQTADAQKELNSESNTGAAGIHLYGAATAGSTASVGILKDQFAAAANAMADTTQKSTDFTSELKMLVNGGLMTADEACAVFKLTADELNATLAGTSDSTSAAIPAITDMKTQIDTLNATYQTAYDSALASLNGQTDLWGVIPQTVSTSVESMNASLQSQIDYFTDYRANLDALASRQIPGCDTSALVASLNDGSEKSAAILAGLATATDAQVAEIAEKLKGIGAAKEPLAADMAKISTDYDAKMQDIVTSTANAVKGMDKSEEAIQSGINTIQGYINGVNSKSATLNLTMSNAAQAAMTAWKKQFDEHSPSKEMQKSGENAIKGAIIGVENMQEELVGVYALTAKNALDAFAGGIDDSAKVVLESAIDMSDALTAEETRLQDKLAKMETDAIKKQADDSEATYKKALADKQAELEKASVSSRQKILDEIAKLTSDREEKLAESSTKNLKDSLNNQLKVVQSFKKEYESAIAAVQKSQDSMSEKLVAFGELFQKTKDAFGNESLGIDDLQPQIDAIKAYGDSLTSLKTRGVSDSLLSEIKGMSVEDATAYTQKLLAMTDTDYAKYMALWDEKQKAAADVAKNFYKGEMDTLKSEFVDKIPDELSSVKDKMTDAGTKLGGNITDGMVAGILAGGPAVGIAVSSLMAQAQSLSARASSAITSLTGQVSSSAPVSAAAKQAASSQNLASDIVNGIAAVMGSTQPTAGGAIILQTVLNDKVIASAIYNPLKDIAKQKGDK